MILQIHEWLGFYALLGTVTATLVGLMFVAVSIGSRAITIAASEQVRTFITPSFIYFSLVLLYAVLYNIPTQTAGSLGAQTAALGAIGVAYSLSHTQRMVKFGRTGAARLIDWMWNYIAPLGATITLVVAAAYYRAASSAAFGMAALSLLALVIVSLRNAWDLLLYLAARSKS